MIERSIEFFIAFSLSVLAVYRVSYMIAMEDGPADVFSLIRERVGQKSWVGRGLNCILCVSFWLSVIPAAYLWIDYDKSFLLSWLAIAGMTLIIHRKVQR